MEIIKSIQEVHNKKLNRTDYSEYDGFLIKTDKQDIFIGIDNHQDCCEQFGYLTSEDNLKDFVGAQLNNIIKVDKALNSKILEQTNSLDEGSAIFVNLETSNGTLQFTVYNSHNGYYGHEAIVISKELNHSQTV